MKTKEELNNHLRERPAQLEEAKKKGVKIVGFLPGNYVPEEMIYASGAVPVCLVHGGDSAVAEAALGQVPAVMCPFSRAQIGERLMGNNPYYKMIDMVIAPLTCQHMKKIAEVWEYHRDINIFKLAVPHQNDSDFALEYYTERLEALKSWLELMTGNQITNEKLNNAINLYNSIRDLFRKLSLIRRSPHSCINSLEFLKLNHASFYADPDYMVETLESVYEKALGLNNRINTDRPRLLLIGPNVAFGDYRIFELVESVGGEIVVEEICEGIRAYWKNVETQGNPIQSLAKAYLRDKLPCAFMMQSSRKRMDFAIDLITEFSVSGVIWYELLCCETYDSESYLLGKLMEERKIPMLILESDYSSSEFSQLKIRVEAFIEQIQGVTV